MERYACICLSVCLSGVVCLFMCSVYAREALCVYLPECVSEWVGACVFACVASMLVKRYACICLSVCLRGVVLVCLCMCNIVRVYA